MGLYFDLTISGANDYKLSSDKTGAHRKILAYAQPGLSILDVGCGAGYIGAAFKEKGCYAVGIEADEKRASQAAKILDKVIVSDIEDIPSLPFPKHSFDIIICADVLEHLKRPDKMLVSLKSYVKEKGIVLISVPNIARIDMRLRLLRGIFRYENGGTMDKTHLRFFTKSTIHELLRMCGYEITKSQTSGIFSHYSFLKIFDPLFAFQFIIAARPLTDATT